MKVKIFDIHDSVIGRRKNVEKEMNKFLREVIVKKILQTSASCHAVEGDTSNRFI